MGSETTTGNTAEFSAEQPREAFCDTNILINYLNREWEAPGGALLIQSDAAVIVICEQVADEIRELIERRHEVYKDFLNFLLEQDGTIEDYSYSGRLQANDYGHIENLQMTLAAKERRRALMQLRRFVSKYRVRGEELLTEHVHEIVRTAAPFMFEMELQKLIPNSADAGIVAAAADWTDQGGSGLLVTDDAKDIVDLTDDINAAIEEHLGGHAVLTISRSRDITLPAESGE